MAASHGAIENGRILSQGKVLARSAALDEIN
jgi:hypothetical protein